MALRINDGWKVLIGTLGLSLFGCGGGGLEDEGSLARTAQGIDGAVTVTLNGEAVTVLECGVSSWVDLGAEATDGAGSPLEVATFNSGHDAFGPGPNANAQGTYYVQYQATDANGATGEAIRTVVVDDTLAPTLTLNGEQTIIHPCGSQFVDPGITATDACYGNLAPSATVTGYVNGWVEGTYTVEYSVTDAAGHAVGPVTRTVQVVSCPWNQY
ncbi:DUF5011 domain-containing protein [Hyalangium versicolor]|uniref:DUF5011 domain-containing protein n=1 Tax=Hyalangium versicolor TaxID=2861190 RepID=UPI001CCE9A71|nr:DUF5011 domain-containing protein [Hyalangium versicolor]